MSGGLETFRLNAGWELTRLRRSQRIWLLLIPPVAAPIGSAIADLYLRIPSVATARILGLLIAGGLAGLILLDLVALAVGEDLTLRAHVTFFALPQGRRALLAGRLAVGTGGHARGVHARRGGGLVRLGRARHSDLAAPADLRSGSPRAGDPRVPGVPRGGHRGGRGLHAHRGAGAGGRGPCRRRRRRATGYLLDLHEATALFPVLLAVAGAGAIGWTIEEYPKLGG